MTVSSFAHAPPAACFALLDDCNASAAEPRSRLYSGYAGSLECRNPADVPALFAQMQQALRQGRHAVGVFSYEFGAQMHGIVPHAPVQNMQIQPAAQVLLFDRCEKLSAEEVTAWLDSQLATDAANVPAGVAGLCASVTEQQFHEAIVRIHDYLKAGDTYQVNYTYRLRFNAYGAAHALYRKLRASQPVPYGALIGLPDGQTILSFSPELFVRHEAGRLTAQPMKGTAAASDNAQQDSQQSALLAADLKTRAENLMIVDLLRNDLGRIAQPGSVQVPQLFEVNRFGRVLQMTSTVTARGREGATLAEIFAALYPCGSVTGAPKHRTMQIIRELEPDPRGIYTGAIGWFDAPGQGQSIGDFCLSVPIRTLVLQLPGSDGLRRGEMGVGAGIVHDSVAAREYEECQLKARFLTGLRHDFALLETMHASHDGCRHLERHVRRLHASAVYFGFVWDEEHLRDSIRQACSSLPPPGPFRMRLTLNHDGTCTIVTAPLASIAEPVKLLLATQYTDANDLFLRHKTTVRAAYDAAWKAAEAQGAFDMLFCNQYGEVTEGARSNLFVKLRGRWVTPPLASGLLPGVMRSVLLDDPAWNACEQPLNLQDLRQAEEIMVCNALRGVLKAEVDWPADLPEKS